MNQSYKAVIISAFAVLGFTACQKEELSPAKNEDTGATHTVNFVTETPETKTSWSADSTTVKYAWSDGDKDRFTIYEINGETVTKATTTTGTYNSETKTISLQASFGGKATAGASYQAVFNSGVQSTQTATSVSYDQLSDVLISEKIQSSSIESEALLLKFKREVAMARVTLKNINNGTKLTNLRISTNNDKSPLSGTYDRASNSFESTSTIINITAEENISSNSATLRFVSIPIKDAYLTMVATVTDGINTYKYVKSFSRSITFEKNDVMDFSVDLTGCETLFYESFDQNTAIGGNDGTWSGTETARGTIKYDNDTYKAEQRVNGANHCAKIGGATQEGRLMPNFPISGNATLKFKAGSWKDKNSQLSLSVVNGAATLSETDFALEDSEFKEYTIYITDVTSENIDLSFYGTKAFFLDEIRVYNGLPTNYYSITCNQPSSGGTIAASNTVSKEGETVTLTATPDNGYEFVSWAVTKANSESVPVTDNSFTMPASNVTVSATFQIKTRVVTYSIKSTTEVIITGDPPSNSSASYSSTYSSKCQLTKDNSMTLTLSGYAGQQIKGIVLSMKSNTSSGAGTFSAIAGTTTIAEISSATYFNEWYDNTEWTTSYKDVNVILTNSSYTINNEDVVITIAATANSLYCQSFKITYSLPASN